MEQHTDLAQVLAPHFPLHKARLVFVARFVLALLKVSTVNLARISTALNGTVTRESNERRCARFLSGFDLAQELIARCVLALVPAEKLVLSLDRTEHYFGAISVNVLTLGVAYQGIAFPLVWSCLGKTGNSNTAERIALMQRALKLVSPSQLLALTADREFVGVAWFAFLKTQGIPFVIRIRCNTLVRYRQDTAPAALWFNRFTHGDTGQIKKPCWVMGQRVYLIAQKLAGDEWLLLAASHKPAHALCTYAQRWEIESLFGAFKTRGFNFEDTHLTRTVRIERLFGLMAVALVWAHKVGELIAKRTPIPVKTHGRKQFSVFRYGLDQLRQLLQSGQCKKLDWHAALRVLSGT